MRGSKDVIGTFWQHCLVGGVRSQSRLGYPTRVEAGVDASGCDEFVVMAVFDEVAGVKNEDPVRFLGSGQAMRDHHARALVQEVL